MAHWIIHNNIRTADSHLEFRENVERLGVNFTKVNLFPFVDKIFSEHTTPDEVDTAEDLGFHNAQKTVINGSIKLCRLARERGITPGSFLTDNSDFPAYLAGYGAENVLNFDSRYGKIKDLEPPEKDGYYFLKPVHDNKLFNGMELNKIQYTNWRNGILETPIAPHQLHGESEILISESKRIYKEYRFFVVNKKIVTYSLYKIGLIVTPKIDMNDDIYTFTEQMINKWNPADAYVIDVAMTPLGNKVVELNAFGGSGFYCCDTQKIIIAIEDFLG